MGGYAQGAETCNVFFSCAVNVRGMPLCMQQALVKHASGHRAYAASDGSLRSECRIQLELAPRHININLVMAIHDVNGHTRQEN